MTSEQYILTGLVVTAITGAFNAISSVMSARKQTVIHDLVNSQFSQAKREIRSGNVTNAVLLRKIATLTGTTEDAIRAEVADELLRSEVALPREEVKP